MNGLIIQNQDGKTLTKNLFWYHSQPTEAYVHPVDFFQKINTSAWVTKPAYATPAFYSPESGTTLTGQRYPVD